MDEFSLGQGVTVTSGPFKNIYGVIVFYDTEQEQYLIRFTGQQQLYYPVNEIVLWSEK